MAPIDVVQAQAEEASRRQQLVTTQATLRNNELALKRLIVSGTDDELWKATIVPVDQPTIAAGTETTATGSRQRTGQSFETRTSRRATT